MNLDYTIRAMAALGQSKGQVREALGISRNKFTEIVKLMPDVKWQQTEEEMAARIAGSKKGNETRHRQHLRTVNGVTGSIAELCERFGQCSAVHARRRIRQGWPTVEAITTPALGRRKKAA